MSLLFSNVEMTTDTETCEFMVGGIPREEDDFSGWLAYENFIEGLEDNTEISVHVEAYLYGGGETFVASPEEVAYFYSRIKGNEDFLSERCDNIEDVDFTISHSPNELFGSDFIEL